MGPSQVPDGQAVLDGALVRLLEGLVDQDVVHVPQHLGQGLAWKNKQTFEIHYISQVRTKAATVSTHSRPKVGAQYGEERKFFIRRLSSSPLNTNPLLRNKSCIISFLPPPLLLHLLTLPRESEKKEEEAFYFSPLSGSDFFALPFPGERGLVE